ncbi:helix-turn-helix domain-containing protein [Aliarcobacter cryaerophilus]|uniref:Helix-turn-helix domain-containing protein n=1 Tax=Arcobacter sp. AZ-2023 TaxID=3074453 RepID=A0AA96IIT5_9BACT|nr:helix-turn-helix domain-containing protein [Arcobacter sp. AZ-2023]
MYYFVQIYSNSEVVLEAEIILEKLMLYFNVINYSELAQKIGVAQQNISKWKSRNSVSAIKIKCRELGIYNEIFGDSFNTFTQTGANSQQIKNQNNTGNGAGAFNYANDPKTQIDNNLNIDDDLIPLFQALSIVAKALNKKDKLKEKLENLISDLPKL